MFHHMELMIEQQKLRFLSKRWRPQKFTYSYPYSIGSLEKLEKVQKD